MLFAKHCRSHFICISPFSSTGNEMNYPVIHERVNDRWEVVMTVSDSGYQQVNFCCQIDMTIQEKRK